MLKLLIVDDEPDICELIHKLIDWEAFDFLSLGSVQNGIDAMEIILRQKPDIVITDIQMPGMTGLEMIEKACQMDLQTSFIVISGYREFEYAQQAIRFGVEEYLLKPINKTDLNLVLKRLVQEKGAVQQRQDHAANLQSELLRKNAILRGNELRQTVMDPNRTFNTELFTFQPGEFLVAVVHASFKDRSGIDTDAISNVLENIALRIQDRFKDSCFDCEYVLNDCNAYVFMNYSDDLHLSYKERRDSLQLLLREISVQYQNLCITFALGSPFYSEKDIGRAVETAEHANCLRLYAGSAKVVEHVKLHSQLSNIVCAFSIEDRQRLFQLVESLQKAEACSLVHSVYQAFENSGSYDICNLFQVTRSMILQLRYQISTQGLREEVYQPLDSGQMIPTESDIHTQLANCDSIPDLCSFLCSYISAEIDYCKALQQQKVGEPIRIAQEYVRTHINRQISLEDVSAQAYVSPGYFSTLFKERTGKNFSDYVIEMRIEEAKRLLRQPALSISEVADRVGYADARHFSKVFQKAVGVKPTAYRKFYV